MASDEPGETDHHRGRLEGWDQDRVRRQRRRPAADLDRRALSDRASSARLVELLAPQFTVFNYDRRGRGASFDTPPYAVEREIEDLDAIIDAAGGPVLLYGSSSGANLALQAALGGLEITGLALWDPTSSSTRAGHPG